MTKLVPRFTSLSRMSESFGVGECRSREEAVTDADAIKLEAVVETSIKAMSILKGLYAAEIVEDGTPHGVAPLITQVIGKLITEFDVKLMMLEVEK